VPPPSTKADELVAPYGGMLYRQESPGRPPFVDEGTHFEKGQALYIIEVMKMFNTVRAQFSGTVDKVVFQGTDGTVVQKGQPLFKITPDEKFVALDPKVVEKERRTRTAELLQAVVMDLHEKRYGSDIRDLDVEAAAAGMFIAAV
jgi:pyruvate/2-oxoglutarate dehydrogenase complex dihydrolipoamide acyltransferase (E2) component